MPLASRLLCVLLLFVFRMNGQTYSEESVFKDKHRIYINGSAEIKLEPTSFVLEIGIKEILKPGYDQSKPEIVVSIDSAERALKQFLEQVGFNSEALKLVNVGSIISGNSYFQINLIYKSFELKFKQYSDLERLVKSIKFDGISGITVRRLYEVNAKEIELNLIATALDDARERAKFILASVNKTVGDILEIQLANYPKPNIDDPVTVYGGYNSSSGSYLDLKQNKIIKASVGVTFEIE